MFFAVYFNLYDLLMTRKLRCFIVFDVDLLFSCSWRQGIDNCMHWPGKRRKQTCCFICIAHLVHFNCVFGVWIKIDLT